MIPTFLWRADEACSRRRTTHSALKRRRWKEHRQGFSLASQRGSSNCCHLQQWGGLRIPLHV